VANIVFISGHNYDIKIVTLPYKSVSNIVFISGQTQLIKL